MKRVPVLLLLLTLSGPAGAQTLRAPSSPFHVGIDTYVGASDAPGFRRLTDQFWAGQSTFTPSVAYLRWERPDGLTARLSVGLGKASVSAEPAFRQPVEAWWRQPLRGGMALTAGRFFASFGAQEWQYEAKEGVQWEAAIGRFSLAAALQRDRATQRGNVYLRGGFALEGEGTIGVSLSRGRGFSYGSAFDSGYALDTRLPLGAWTLRGEVDRFFGSGAGRFDFGMGSVSFVAHPGIEPFVSFYRWQDTSSSAELGNFHSALVGVTWQVTPLVSLETAVARADGRRVAWLQMHLAWER